MRIEDPKLYPLEAFLDWIPDAGISITKEVLTNIATFFNLGGVICETHDEVVDCLEYLRKWYNIIELEANNHELILRKANGL
jgi:hypothetical protein